MQAEVLLHTQQTATPHASVQYWRVCQVEELYDLPFMDLVYRAAQVHREHFNPNEIQLSSLLSIKTGGCPEDCAYCPQSAHYDTGVEKQALLQIEDIVPKPKSPKSAVRAVFAWALLGVAHTNATWTNSPKSSLR